MKKRSKHLLYPEPGAHVLQSYEGLPKLSPPDPLPPGKISSHEIRDDYIAYEGLGYCVYSLIPSERIEDEKLKALWVQAREAMQDVVEYLEQLPTPKKKKKSKRKSKTPRNNTKKRSRKKVAIKKKKVKRKTFSAKKIRISGRELI